MMPLMSTLKLRFLVPFLVLGAALVAQDGKDKPKQDPKSDKTPAAEKADKSTKDDKVTADDPAIQGIDKFIKKASVNTKVDGWKTGLTEPPVQKFSPDHDYFWHVETSLGSLKAKLYTKSAPLHATCGIYLSRLGFYDGLTFHRIITNFMAQGGCPMGTGSGGPGYTIDGEYDDGVKHDRPGLLSTANTGMPRSDGSQFFLTFVPTPWLDGKHTIWGEVVEGMETVKALEKVGTQSGKVANPPRIVRTWVSVAAKAKPEGQKAKQEGKDGDDKKKDEQKKG
jgi:peptidyl-prolyl cis-trans isomerase B (cyclophilin B)